MCLVLFDQRPTKSQEKNVQLLQMTQYLNNSGPLPPISLNPNPTIGKKPEK